MELNNNIQEHKISDDLRYALKRYFTSLENVGYVPYNKVDELLIVSHIEELLTGTMSFYITEKDYMTMTKCLYKVYGRCLMPYPDYKRSYSQINESLPYEYRVIEDSSLRKSLRLRVKD